MGVIWQLLEKPNSTATTEKNVCFWSKETLLNRCSWELQADRKSAANNQEAASPSFLLGFYSVPLIDPY